MDKTTDDNRSNSPDPRDKVESDHIELGHVQDKAFVGGHVVTQLPTTASVQAADIEPDLQIRAVVITFAAGLFWFVHLYHLSALAAYSRNIAAILGNPDLSPWVFNAFNIPIIVVAPILSSLSDVTARKWFIVVPVAMGALGAVIACRASTLAQVIAGVAIEGFAGAAMGPITAVPSEVLPHKYRSIGASVVFAMSILGPFPSLPLLGMAIKQDEVNGWRWIFYSALMGYALTAILWMVLYKPPPRRTEYTEKRPSVDWIGYVLLTGASVLFIAGLVWGGVTYPWKSGQVMGTLITGIVLFIVLGLWEWLGRSDGFLHHDLFKERNFPLVIFAIGVEGLIYIAFSSLYPAQVSLVYEHDLVKSASLALPFYAAFFIALPFGALYVNKTRDLVTPVLVGYLLFIVGVVLFIVSKPNTMGMFIVGGAVAGFGFAFPLVFLTVIAQFAAPPALIGTSTSIVLAMRSLGGAVGSTITATILSTKSTEKIPAYVAAAILPLGVSPQLLGPVIGAAAGDAELIQAILYGRIPGVTPQILGVASAAVEHAWSDSFKFSWIAVVAFGVLGLVSVSLLRRDRHKLDFIIDQPLEHVHHKHARKNEV